MLQSFGSSSPLYPSTFAASVADVLAETDEETRQDKWTAILTDVHDAVIYLPLWGKRIPSVTAKAAIEGYAPGYQQFDYPMQDARAVGADKNVTITVGAQTGLFATVGRLDPHTYRPNEFFANYWVYEGLTSYGANGAVEPGLATSWTSTVNGDGTETWRFVLRTGVTFHDGATFDCSVAKLNFDHFWAGSMSGGLRAYHNWYGLPTVADSWSCDGEVFELTTTAAYYPLLQELSFIRPTAMLSPNAFVGGASSDPLTQNTCPSGSSWSSEVTCAGIAAVAGTGPFSLAYRSGNATAGDDLVIFKGFADYWGGAPDVEFMHVVKYATASDVYDALDDGSLDAVLGAGALDPADIKTLQYDSRFDVLHGPEMMTSPRRRPSSTRALGRRRAFLARRVEAAPPAPASTDVAPQAPSS